MPINLMDLITVLRDAGIGIAAIVALIYYIRNASKNDQRSDGIVQQLITLISNNTAVLDKNNDQREKNTIAVNEQTAAMRELKEKTTEFLSDMAGRQSLVTDALTGFDRTVNALVKQIQLLDGRIDTIKIAMEKHPADMVSVAAELRGLAAEVRKSSETIINLLEARMSENGTPSPSLAPPSADMIAAKRESMKHITDEIKPANYAPGEFRASPSVSQNDRHENKQE